MRSSYSDDNLNAIFLERNNRTPSYFDGNLSAIILEWINQFLNKSPHLLRISISGNCNSSHTFYVHLFTYILFPMNISIFCHPIPNTTVDMPNNSV